MVVRQERSWALLSIVIRWVSWPIFEVFPYRVDENACHFLFFSKHIDLNLSYTATQFGTIYWENELSNNIILLCSITELQKTFLDVRKFRNQIKFKSPDMYKFKKAQLLCWEAFFLLLIHVKLVFHFYCSLFQLSLCREKEFNFSSPLQSCVRVIV